MASSTRLGVEMSNAHAEFGRFILSLPKEGMGVIDAKILNVIGRNFETLRGVGTPHGQRSKALINLLRQQFDGLPAEIERKDPDVDVGVKPFIRLTRLSVESCRGFTVREDFDLDSQVVLVYGPNGSGKSSFCEALEYCLLGTVAEADSRRIPVERYLENAALKGFQRPVLSAAWGDKIAAVVPHNRLYRFCFVEKNRIDDFGRIAAKTAGQQQAILGTLLGLDDFNDFVNGFNEDLRPYLDTVGTNGQDLAKRRLQIAAAEQIVTAAGQALEQITREENALLEQGRPGLTFPEFCQELAQDIAALEADLARPIGTRIAADEAAYQEALRRLTDSTSAMRDLRAEHDTKKQEVVYRQLYLAVVDLRAVNPDSCPACETKIGPHAGHSGVQRDPYEKAAEGLRQLEFLAQLEARLEEAQLSARAAAAALVAQGGRVLNAQGLDCRPELEALGGALAPYQLHQHEAQLAIDVAEIQGAAAVIFAQAREHDFRVAGEAAAREATRRSLDVLRERFRTVDTLKARRNSEVTRKEQAQAAIDQFNNINAALLKRAEEEVPAVKRNGEIVAAYDRMLSAMRRYKSELPAHLLKGLNDTAKTVYNELNAADPPGDRLASLTLPSRPNEHISITLEGAPHNAMDALHVLSEGHIRCLGLALLIARNVADGCPLIVFDDAVNAIDDDHRRGLRNLLFANDLLKGKQLIVTCHGEEFVKSIEQQIGHQAANKASRFTFLPHVGDRRLKIRHKSETKNYVLNSQEAFENGNMRMCLAEGRRALEDLMVALWRFAIKHFNGEISVAVRGPDAMPDLMSKASSLRRKLGNEGFTHAQKEAIVAAIDPLLGIEKNTPGLWNYLNKGTHDEEDRAEFDRASVKIIVDSIAALDTALRGKKPAAAESKAIMAKEEGPRVQ